MKLSNFKMIKTIGTSALNYEYFAEVDVTTGFLCFKKTNKRKIHKSFLGYWHFIDTGEFTPNYQAETLERSYNAKIGELK